MAQQIIPIVELLAQEYGIAIHQRNGALKKDGKPEIIDHAAAFAAIATFRTFCAEYLAKHRPAQLQAADGNYIVQLTNLKQCLISPPLDAQSAGTMQPAHAVPVTGRESIGEVDFGDGIPITNPNVDRTVPPGAMDYAQDQGLQNMTLPQPSQPLK